MVFCFFLLSVGKLLQFANLHASSVLPAQLLAKSDMHCACVSCMRAEMCTCISWLAQWKHTRFGAAANKLSFICFELSFFQLFACRIMHLPVCWMVVIVFIPSSFPLPFASFTTFTSGFFSVFFWSPLLGVRLLPSLPSVMGPKS